jgi:hypothetical protein
MKVGRAAADLLLAPCMFLAFCDNMSALAAVCTPSFPF